MPDDFVPPVSGAPPRTLTFLRGLGASARHVAQNKTKTGLPEREAVDEWWVLVTGIAGGEAGRYTGKAWPVQWAGDPAGDLTQSDLGTPPSAVNCEVWDIAQCDGNGTPRPLTDQVFKSDYVGVRNSKLILSIESSVQEIRFNSDTLKLQVSYISNPGEDAWVDMVTFGPC